jgi:hypothetical protein
MVVVVLYLPAMPVVVKEMPTAEGIINPRVG